MTAANLWSDCRRKTRIRIAAFFTCIFFFLHTCIPTDTDTVVFGHRQSPLHCVHGSVSEDVLVVLRTGATEVLEKLPTHLETTLRCVPNYVIYSDYEEEILGHHIYDVFDEVSPELKAKVPDFDLYHQLKARGRKELIINGINHDGSGSAGMLSNPAWKLDKFKFLPMIDKAFRHRSHAKWFVFIELDTYLVWSNLLDFLSRLDSDQPYYLGKQMYIGDVLFAHGGSGFALSAAAMRKTTGHWRANKAAYDQYTITQWAGDMVLGKLLKDIQIPLTWSFPHFQGDPISILDHNITKADRKPWCHPALTYHHMRTEEVRALWSFEQAWRRSHRDTALLRHADVFRGFVQPFLVETKNKWDNYSVNSELSARVLQGREAPANVEACRAACVSEPTCLQFSFRTASCALASEVRLGRRSTEQCLEYSLPASKCARADGELGKEAVVSGWIIERLADYVQSLDQMCEGSSNWVV